METIETIAADATGWLAGLLNVEIYNGQSLSDFLSLDVLLSMGASIVGAVTILIIGFLFAGFIGRKVRRLGLAYEHLDDTLFNFLGNILRYIVLAFTAMFVLNTFGIQTTSIVAIVGAASLAIGLALQGTLSNVAAGVMIIFFRPLKIGDFVQVNGVMGNVKDITLNYTEIASIGNVKVVVPNANVWGNTIYNYSVYDTRRAEWEFGVGYGVNLAQAEQVIRDTIMADERSMVDPEPFIQVNNLGSSSVDFLVRVWCTSDVYFQYQADMKRKVKEALDNADIAIPFPTRTIVQENISVDS